MPLLVFLVAAAYLPIPSAATAPRWAILSLGVALLLFFTRVRMSPAHYMGAAFLAFAWASVAWSAAPFSSINYAWQLTVLAGAFVIAAELPDAAWGSVWDALAIGVSLSAPVAIAQFFGWHGVQAVTSPPIVGLFLSKAFLAQAGMLALIPALLRRRWLLAIGPFVCMALPMAREQLVVAAVAGLAWALPRISRRWLVATAVVLAALLGAAAIADVQATDRMASLSNRLEIWAYALPNLKPFGWGLDTFGDIFPAFEYAHNEFLQFAFELGAGSLLLWAVMAYALGGRPEIERLTLVAVLVMSCFTFPLHLPLSALVAALSAGRLCGHRFRASLRQSDGGISADESFRYGDAGGYPICPAC